MVDENECNYIFFIFLTSKSSYEPAMLKLYQATVSQKVVNREKGRTTILTICDRFTNIYDLRPTRNIGRKFPTGFKQS